MPACSSARQDADVRPAARRALPRAMTVAGVGESAHDPPPSPLAQRGNNSTRCRAGVRASSCRLQNAIASRCDSAPGEPGSENESRVGQPPSARDAGSDAHDLLPGQHSEQFTETADLLSTQRRLGIASGVLSRPVMPVPPVISTICTAGSAIQPNHRPNAENIVGTIARSPAGGRRGQTPPPGFGRRRRPPRSGYRKRSIPQSPAAEMPGRIVARSVHVRSKLPGGKIGTVRLEMARGALFKNDIHN